jgi:type IV pilus assembly protein PilO
MNLGLTRLPWYTQIGAFMLLGIGGMGAFYYCYEMPAEANRTAREGQLAGLRRDISRGLATAKKLPEFQAQVNDLESRLASLHAVLPEEKDAADLLRQIETVATQSNLVIKSFAPKMTITKQLHAEWPIEIELDGTYHNLAMFFDRVGRFTRIVNISSLEVQAKDKPVANSTISATCTATTFVLLDTPTTPKSDAAKPGVNPAAPRPKV